MMTAVLRFLPLIAGAQDAPAANSFIHCAFDRRIGLKLIGGELAPEADIVGDADRLVEALAPDRDEPIDRGPGAHGLDPNPLMAMKLSLGQGETPQPSTHAAYTIKPFR
jgi:hypothetical protein